MNLTSSSRGVAIEVVADNMCVSRSVSASAIANLVIEDLDEFGSYSATLCSGADYIIGKSQFATCN